MRLLPSALLAVLVTAAAISLVVFGPQPASLFTFPVVLSVSQLCVTPFLRNIGLYEYHSEMLKATLRTSRMWEIHGGTSWDYLRLFRFSERGGVATRRLLLYYLEGLLDIARRVEQGEIGKDVIVTGTSYFFSKRSATRLGFRLEPAGPRLRAVLVLYYLDLVLLYSFARGRIAFPNVLRARRASIRASELAARRGEIETLIGRLERTRRSPQETGAPGASDRSRPREREGCTRSEARPAA